MGFPSSSSSSSSSSSTTSRLFTSRATTAASFAIVGIATFLYWAYKKIREPAYKPGSVAQWVADAAADEKTTGNQVEVFDHVDLYDVVTTTTESQHGGRFWIMPDQMKVFYFTPSTPKMTVPVASSSPILALHGGPAIPPSQPWQRFASDVDLGHNFYLYHTRGCGYSTRPFGRFPTPGRMWPGIKLLEQTLGLRQQIADIERIRRRLEVQYYRQSQPSTIKKRSFQLDLVGHSFGGFVAAMYASEFPQHVRSLVLLVPASVLKLPVKKNKKMNESDVSEDLFDTVRRKLMERSDDHPEWMQDYDAFFKRYMDFGSLPHETDQTLAMRQDEFAMHYERAQYGKSSKTLEELKTKNGTDDVVSLTGGMACYATFLSMGMEHDYIPMCQQLLQNSTFPVTIVHGGNDMMSESTSRQYVQLFPPENVTFHSIPDADHFLYDHPDVIRIVKETHARVVVQK